jgi:hypothetical protein
MFKKSITGLLRIWKHIPTLKFEDLLDSDYTWLTGAELTKMVNAEDFQWIWAVLSGFPKNVTKEQAIMYDLPYANNYEGFWKNSISIQHPLAEVEIVPWDSSLVLIISKNDKIVDNFMNSMPLSEDLEIYNTNFL